MLDPIHNQGLRLALGVFRTSPVASLNVVADEPSLYSRRKKLSLQYTLISVAYPSNPAHKAPHFFTKMLESNILYDNLLIDILSV